MRFQIRQGRDILVSYVNSGAPDFIHPLEELYVAEEIKVYSSVHFLSLCCDSLVPVGEENHFVKEAVRD